jgi:hypothetical protein
MIPRGHSRSSCDEGLLCERGLVEHLLDAHAGRFELVIRLIAAAARQNDDKRLWQECAMGFTRMVLAACLTLGKPAPIA